MKTGRYDSAILSAFSCLIVFALFALSSAQAGPWDRTQAHQEIIDQQSKKSDTHRKSTVRSIRYWSTSDSIRMVIEMDSDAPYKKNRLQNPDRIYFDISNAIADKDLHNRTFLLQDLFVKKIRVAQHTLDTVRVVVEVSDFLDCTVSKLKDPYRIIVELRSNPKEQDTIEAPHPIMTAVSLKQPAVETKIQPFPDVDIQGKDIPPAKKKPPESDASNLCDAIVPLGALIQKDLPDSPTAAEPTSSGERTLTRMLGLKIGRIVLDPGHGGHDLGTVGKGGLLEKDLTLALAFRLKEMLEQKLGSEVILTRDKDTFVSLEERTDIANRNRADLFISIHANSSRSASISGVETYYLDFAKTESEREVAARENAGAGRSISELGDLVKRIAEADKSAESRELASMIQEKLFSGARTLSPSTRNRGVRRAPFVVLIGANMPSILTEVAFISNPKDEKILSDEENRNHLADALFSGIEDYVKKLGSYPIAYQAAQKK